MTVQGWGLSCLRSSFVRHFNADKRQGELSERSGVNAEIFLSTFHTLDQHESCASDPVDQFSG